MHGTFCTFNKMYESLFKVHIHKRNVLMNRMLKYKTGRKQKWI